MDDDTVVNSIVRGIGYTENGGKPDPLKTKAGKTGELKSVFQYTPDTWNNYSKQVFGKVVPLDPDAETHVTKTKVKNWYDEDKKKGYQPDVIVKRIASRWNAGQGEPDAYTGRFSDGSPSTGLNKKYGVKYDVKGYTDKVSKYFDEFSKEQPLKEQPNKGLMAQAMEKKGAISNAVSGVATGVGAILSAIKDSNIEKPKVAIKKDDDVKEKVLKTIEQTKVKEPVVASEVTKPVQQTEVPAKVDEKTPLSILHTERVMESHLNEDMVKRAIKDGDLEPDDVYLQGDILQPAYLKTRIPDIAINLNKLKPGLGEVFKRRVNTKNATFAYLKKLIDKVIEENLT